MLDHVSITVPDIEAVEPFYDAIMAALGVPKVGRSETWLGYGERCDADHPTRSYLSIRLGPTDLATQGRHWCFKAQDRAAVDAFWRTGLARGGIDDGPPGIRVHYHPAYDAAFLLDPADNRLDSVCHHCG
jgi:catechol 2,3-dioxygenase-like lactoylglutathione lyase family enzyme